MADIFTALITTIGTLVGSFGGFTLAARAQRRQAERDDERAQREARHTRSLLLEDERHEFELRTLIALQELARRHTRTTLLTIIQDKKTLQDGLGYRMLPKDDPDDFANAVEFSHQIARVTSPELRTLLEAFSARCAELTLPPHNWKDLHSEQAIRLQDERADLVIREGAVVAARIGEHLRREIDRHHSLDG
ncbi:hypothetical protein [Microbacterium sp.]|uniref:hypothetical protein n=1 Tax=Microbacterium sp. TaxID=51671 RepID=UPI000CC9AE0A|nr:hypothetical protein CTI14_10235 [Methylobacterium radiotolerans]